MLLVLTLVATTLMGVMVTDVNAAKATADAGDDLNNRVWTLDMLSSGDGYTTRAFMATGKWVVKPVGQAEGGQATYDLGEITIEPKLGKDYWHIDFDAFTYMEGDVANQISGNYVRFRTDSTNPAIGESATSGIGKQGTAVISKIANFNKIVCGTTVDDVKTYGNVLKYTFYAYTKDTAGESFVIQFANTSSSLGSVELKASDLYSPNGIPHRIDIYVWSNSVDGSVAGSKSATGLNKNEAIYYAAVMDGCRTLAKSHYLETSKSAYNASGFAINFYSLFSPTTKESYSYKGANWYVSNVGSALETKTRADFSEDSFRNFVMKDTYTSKVDDGSSFKSSGEKKDFITGVINSVTADLEKALVANVVGADKEITVGKNLYNNPAMMFTGEESNVKLVDKITGAEVAVADATGTMADYYFMVNGVYVLVNEGYDYYVSEADAFSVESSEHQNVKTRIYYEDYVNNEMDADLPALGGLRGGFLKYTNAPRGTFSFYNGNVKYGTNDGYYSIDAPQISLSDNIGYDKKVTLEFDMYVPEFVSTSSNRIRLILYSHTDPNSTAVNITTSGITKSIGDIYFTTNGLTDSTFDEKIKVDLPGNAWNTVAISFDSTNTADTGRYDVSIYVNGVLKESYQTGAYFKDNAAKRLCTLAASRFYMPMYVGIGIMNDNWYVGEYTSTVTPNAEGVIDTDKVSGVELAVDNVSNLIGYDATNDADYSNLIAAMEAAGYQPVYDQVIDVDLINEKYDEVDGLFTNVVNDDGTRTVTGKLVKRWMDNSGTDRIVKAVIDENGFSTYTIVKETVTKAVDNGDGTASITFTSKFGETGSYSGVASTPAEIIAALAAEEPPRSGIALELTGFAVVEEGKLPKIYSLQGSGTELYALSYDDATNVATLTYREFAGTDVIPFVFVVAAYDINGKMIGMDVSEAITIDAANEADGVNTKTFTADFGELNLTTVGKFKVFALNNIVSAMPIINNNITSNSAYIPAN